MSPHLPTVIGTPVAIAKADSNYVAPKPIPTKEEQSNEWINWGDDNNLPTKLRNYVEKNVVLSRGIITRAQVMVAGQLVYGQFDEAIGDYKRTVNDDVDDFLESWNSRQFLNDLGYEFSLWNQAFIRILLTKDGKKIARLFVEQTMFVRYAKPSNFAKGEQPKEVFLHASWANGPQVSELLRIPLLDPYRPLADQFAERPTNIEFIFPIRGQNSGRELYLVPDWYAAVEAKWLTISGLIANYKEAFLKNATSVKTLIEIHREYWKTVIPNWHDLEPAKQEEEVKKLLDEIEDYLSGTENAGKTLVTTSGILDGEEVGVKIKQLEHKLLDGQFIEDSAETNAHILFSLGVDGTLIGSTPGKNMGAGSGSDKREAYNILVTNLQGDQDNLVKIIQKAARFNGFNFKFWVVNSYIQTMNQVTPSKRSANV